MSTVETVKPVAIPPNNLSCSNLGYLLCNQVAVSTHSKVHDNSDMGSLWCVNNPKCNSRPSTMMLILNNVLLLLRLCHSTHGMHLPLNKILDGDEPVLDKINMSALQLQRFSRKNNVQLDFYNPWAIAGIRKLLWPHIITNNLHKNIVRP